MTIQHPWALWLSGFLAAAAVVHAVPLIIRHDLIIAGVQLTTTATVITTVVSMLLSVGAWKMAKTR